MKLILAGTGSYPRIGDDEEQQILRKTIAAWEKGEKSNDDLGEAEDRSVIMAIKEQTRAGLELITDGLMRWHDPVSHMAGKLEGVEINGLLRFFDTNFYFRQPIIKGKLRWTEPIVVDEFIFAGSVSSRPVKPVITGPYTLARLSVSSSDSYRTIGKITENFAEELAKEIRELSQAGAEIIQVDEPAIVKYPRDYEIFREAVVVINGAKGNSKLALYTYFGDAAPLYSEFQTLPVDVLGVDFTYSKSLAEVVSREGSEKPLGLGLIDGRNTKFESKKRIIRALEKILPRIKDEFAYLNPSCGLEYLPRDRAFEKLRNMAEIKKEFVGVFRESQ